MHAQRTSTLDPRKGVQLKVAKQQQREPSLEVGGYKTSQTVYCSLFRCFATPRPRDKIHLKTWTGDASVSHAS